MLRAFVRGSFALVLALATTGGARAQVQNTQPATNQPARNHALHVKQILGATINLQGGAGIGTVQDVILNDDGVVDYLIASDTSTGKLVTIPWEAVKFNYQQRTAVINITQEQFRQIPMYTVERFPDFYAPAYRTQIYRHFNLVPGRERRLERREERRENRP